MSHNKCNKAFSDPIHKTVLKIKSILLIALLMMMINQDNKNNKKFSKLF
jgi:hypothetical protein